MYKRGRKTRRCLRCGRRKPVRAFPNGHHSRCKICLRKEARAAAEHSKTWIRDFVRHWQRETGGVVERANAFVNGRRGKASDADLMHPYYRLRHEAIVAYGGYRCACRGCTEEDPAFLTIDHVNGGGRRERKRFGGGIKFHKWLHDAGYPPGYQVLCANCNLAKYRNGGVCPHEDGSFIGGSRAQRV